MSNTETWVALTERRRRLNIQLHLHWLQIVGVNHLSCCFIKNSHHVVPCKCLTLWAVVWDASLTPSLLVKMDEIESVGKAGRQKRERCVYPFTALEDLHYRASRSCQRLFITWSHISTPGVQTVRSVACQEKALSGKVLLSPRSPSPRLIPDCEAGEARQKGRNRVCHQQLKRVAWQQDWWHPPWK